MITLLVGGKASTHIKAKLILFCIVGVVFGVKKFANDRINLLTDEQLFSNCNLCVDYSLCVLSVR